MNIDSEDDGIFLIGCAGAATVMLPSGEEGNGYGQQYVWHTEGLMGGHSGMEISRGRANANKIFGRFLAECMDEIGFSIVSVSGERRIMRLQTSTLLGWLYRKRRRHLLRMRYGH